MTSAKFGHSSQALHQIGDVGQIARSDHILVGGIVDVGHVGRLPGSRVEVDLGNIVVVGCGTVIGSDAIGLSSRFHIGVEGIGDDLIVGDTEVTPRTHSK